MYLWASSLLGHFHNGLLLHGSLCCVCKKRWQSGKKKKKAWGWTLWSYTTWLPAWGSLWRNHWQPEPRCPASHHREGRAPLGVRQPHWPCLSLALALPTWPVFCSVKLCTESLTGLLWRVNAITHAKYFFMKSKRLVWLSWIIIWCIYQPKKKKKEQGKKESDLWINKQ